MNSLASKTLWTALLAALLALSAGCHTEPYCVNCTNMDAVANGDAARDGQGSDVLRLPDGRPYFPDAGCSPTNVEVCNGIDDNCDGVVDEGFDLQTDLRNCGACGNLCQPAHAVGQCVTGTCRVAPMGCDVGWYDLDNNPVNGCEYACNPTGAERCDGVDNNCDGRVDEGFNTSTDPANCGRCGMSCRFNNASALCAAGTCALGACVDGYSDVDHDPTNGCEYSCHPTGPEVCDRVDNNCDGVVDEGFDTSTDPLNCGACGRRCTFPNAVPGCAMGACSVASCMPGFRDLDGRTENGCEWACGNPDGSTSAETCDGRDNDCNGRIDEGVTMSCTTACGAGMQVCQFGTFGACLARTASAEICNGLDDDCNGMADENLGQTTCGVGVCQRTVQNCVGGTARVCTPNTALMAAESCNNLDDDCDGTVDNFTQPCMGPCGAGTRTCVNGAFGTCVTRQPTAEVCNGVDDNCNGTTDENLGSTTCGLGTCQRTVQNCAAGAAQGCTPNVGASRPELCDGLDNDCDGAVDNGNPGGGGACGTCGQGRLQCLGGTLQCVGDVSPTAELCNGRDDNCNGMIDEGALPGAGLPCGTSNVGACTLGTTACTAGALVCVGARNATAETCDGVDNDCNGLVDDGALTPPAGFVCNQRGLGTDVGVCAAAQTPRSCRMGSFQCAYPATYRNLAAEAYCDGLDNNCDGVVDEGCLTVIPAAADVRIDQGAGNSIQPALAGLGDANNVALVYLDNRNGNADIFFSRSTNAGTAAVTPTWSADLALDNNGANQVRPALFGQGTTYNSLWSDFRDNSTARSVYGNRSLTSGMTFVGSNSVAVTTGFDAFNVQVVASGTRVTSVWEQLEVDRSRHIWASRSSDSGATWSAPVRVDTGPAANVASRPALAQGAANNVFAVWRDARNAQTDVYFSSSTDGGATWLATDLRLELTASPSDDPDVDADAAGNVYVAWSQVAAANRTDIFLRHSSNAGGAFTVATRVETDPLPHDSYSPQVLAMPGGAVTVLWIDDRFGRPNLVAGRSADGGTTWPGPDQRLQANAPGATQVVALAAATSNGTVFAAWSDAREFDMATGRTFTDLYANYSLDGGQRFQPADRRLDSAPVNVDSETPAIYSVSGFAHVVWVDRRNGTNGDIYYRAVRTP